MQPVGPCPDNGADARLKRLARQARRRAAVTPDDEMHARQRPFRKIRVIGRQPPAEDTREIVADAHAHSGVESITRNEGQN